MRKLKRVTLITCVLFCVLEGLLRSVFGFCDAVLIREDDAFEYIAQANQHRNRFGNKISYNSVSMRSEEVDSNAEIMLGFGDSFINGGTLTDQDSLATTLLSQSLSELKGDKVQFLNISAGSWGPDNCFAYLEKYGVFGAKIVFLFVSSHDAYDNMDFEPIVGRNLSFPDKQYTLALVELFDRYLIPRLGFSSQGNYHENLGIRKKTKDSSFNPGFESFYSYCKNKQIPLVIYLHAEVSELKKRQYNDQGKEIIDFALKHDIVLIKDLDLGLTLAEFRDNIHVNELGQMKLAERVLTGLGQ